MIAEFVELFMAGKPKLEALFSEKHPENYKAIVEAVMDVLNNGDDYGAPDPKRIHELDDGDYQGTLVYVIAATGYQPSDYWYVKVATALVAVATRWRAFAATAMISRPKIRCATT